MSWLVSELRHVFEVLVIVLDRHKLVVGVVAIRERACAVNTISRLTVDGPRR
jgi:hypothetical protein